MLFVGAVMRYAICGALLGLAIGGAYYSGYAVGSRDVKVECANKKAEVIIQEKEVIKYVDKQKDKIYSSPAAVPADIIRLFNEGKL
jgi:hypothetical protein